MPWNDLHILTSVSKALVNALIHNCIIIIIYLFFFWKLLTESIREHVSSAFDQTVHYNGLLIAKVGTVNTECSRVYRTDVLRHWDFWLTQGPPRAKWILYTFMTSLRLHNAFNDIAKTTWGFLRQPSINWSVLSGKCPFERNMLVNQDCIMPGSATYW